MNRKRKKKLRGIINTVKATRMAVDTDDALTAYTVWNRSRLDTGDILVCGTYYRDLDAEQAYIFYIQRGNKWWNIKEDTLDNIISIIKNDIKYL